jgi:hypothetical protein
MENGDIPDIYEVDIYQKISELGKKIPKYAEYEKLKALLTNISEEQKKFYITNLFSSNQIRNMNLPLMAEVITFMDRANNIINKNTVNQKTVQPYVNHVLPKKSEYVEKYGLEDYNLMEKEMYSSFFRYVRHVKNNLPSKK